MAKFRKVDPRIWNDCKFRSLTDSAKLAFLFVLTHPSLTHLGAMRATVEGLAAELGWSTEAFRDAFGEALSNGMAKHDSKACFFWLPNFLKYNKPESPNVVKAWEQSIDLLPECTLKTALIRHGKAYAEGLGKAFGEALPEAFRKPMPNQEQKQEQKQEQEQEQESPSDSLSPSNGDKEDFAAKERELIGRWNATPGVRAIRGERLTDSRRSSLRTRLKNSGWFGELLQALAKFPLKCTVNDPDGWKPDADWILQPDSVQKILEGKYDYVKGNKPAPRTGAGQQYDPDAKEKDSSHGNW